VGGTFTNLTGHYFRHHIARFHVDGSIDVSFSAQTDTNVGAIVVQPDGDILIGGGFTNVSGASRLHIARLKPDGSVDEFFNASPNGAVHTIVLEEGGTILIGGEFTMIGEVSRQKIARINSDGSLNLDFNPNAAGAVTCIAVQADGKLLVGGEFSGIAGALRQGIARLNPDGSLDETFDPAANGNVYSIAVQADGAILLGGSFSEIGSQVRSNMARLRMSGEVDEFNASAISVVHSVQLLGDGKVLAGGKFTQINGLPRLALALFINTSGATQNLSRTGTTVTWMRGGTAPELSQCRFDYSLNGLDWTELPTPGRIEGGWQLEEVTVPTNATIRARGTVTGAFRNGSGWFVEQALGPPAFSFEPSDVVVAGFNEGFNMSAVAATQEPVSYSWLRDGVVIAGATQALYGTVITNSTRYQVVISNALGVVTSRVARAWFLGPDSFVSHPTANGYVAGQLPDASVITVGKPLLARHLTNGGFRAAAGSMGRAVVVLPDRSVIVGGSFTNTAGKPATNLERIRSDGTPDPSFKGFANKEVHALAVQSDGKIIVGGTFTNLSEAPRLRLGRIHPDGTIDLSFLGQVNGPVDAVAIQPDGKVLIGGAFDSVNNTPRSRLARLSSNGDIDPSFAVSVVVGSSVLCLAVQPDGKIVLGGDFLLVGGFSRRNMARLNSDGSLDRSFNLHANAPVQTLALQTDGGILLGGFFDSISGAARAGIARATADGSLDPDFRPVISGSLSSVYSVVLQDDGRVLLAGTFSKLREATRSGIGRLYNTAEAVQHLVYTNSTITWNRSGAAPEIMSARFEYSFNGVDWNELPVPARFEGGWQLAEAEVPAGATLRATGHSSGGYFSGSQFLMESSLGPPVMLPQDSIQALDFGQTKVLTAEVIGTGPFTYRWFQDGVLLDGKTNSWISIFVPGTYEVEVTSLVGGIRKPFVVARYGADSAFNATADGIVSTIVLQPDGKVLVAGGFTNSPGRGIARLNRDGSVDPTFSSSVSNGVIGAMALQADGKIVVGGTFSRLGGEPRYLLGRLHPDGSLDTAFHPNLLFQTPDEVVRCLAIQPDGKILVGGRFDRVDNLPRAGIAGLNADGIVDQDFVPPNHPWQYPQWGFMAILIEPWAA